MTNSSWRVDETYIEVKGKWIYLYRAVDSDGATVEFMLKFMLSPTRDALAAKRFFRKALRAKHTVPPRVINVDRNPALLILKLWASSSAGALCHSGVSRGRSST